MALNFVADFLFRVPASVTPLPSHHDEHGGSKYPLMVVLQAKTKACSIGTALSQSYVLAAGASYTTYCFDTDQIHVLGDNTGDLAVHVYNTDDKTMDAIYYPSSSSSSSHSSSSSSSSHSTSSSSSSESVSSSSSSESSE